MKGFVCFAIISSECALADVGSVGLRSCMGKICKFRACYSIYSLSSPRYNNYYDYTLT